MEFDNESLFYIFKSLSDDLNSVDFGLSSALELFMAKTDTLFGDIKGCFPYFADLIIAGTHQADHDCVLKWAFGRTRKNNMRFNMEKMQYWIDEVKFLVVIVNVQP